MVDEHRSLGLNVIGIDVEDEKVKHAEALHPRLNLASELGDITSFPYGRRDFVASHYTLQFLEPSGRVEAIDKVLNSLRPCGGTSYH